MNDLTIPRLRQVQQNLRDFPKGADMHNWCDCISGRAEKIAGTAVVGTDWLGLDRNESVFYTSRWPDELREKYERFSSDYSDRAAVMNEAIDDFIASLERSLKSQEEPELAAV